MLDKRWALGKKRINVVAVSMYFQKDENRSFTPLKNANKGDTVWQKTYQAVKHYRARSLEKATVMATIRALATLYLLNIYYKSEKYEASSLRTFRSEYDY
jgi:hypothetical protein